MSTVLPNSSSVAVFDAFRYACWLQVPFERTNT